ncbi:G-protein coupled receptor 84-like [Scyliorhinus canicula]|uniref:G-protein coupled receptor 84-like n=1 Tax=Scyliorhinus canicula TaxID=7830 RepID=UPI0018F78A7B|nr:G-protein coupled receptor 84-like [Scyliorhinus canicula]
MDPNSSFSNLTCHPAVVNYRYFGALLGILVTAVGTVGNVMTVLAFATDKRIRTRLNVLIINLTVADLIYCAVLQPVTTDTFIHFAWRQGEGMCRVFGLILFVANAVSIFSLILIAMSRYVLISDARRFDRVFSGRTMPFFVALPWLLGLTLFGPLWNIYVFLPPVCTCSFHRERGRPYTTILMLFMFGLGLSCIGIFYFLIHRKVKAASQALEGYRLEGDGRGRKPTGAGVSAADSGIANVSSANSLSGEAPTRSTDATSIETAAPGREIALQAGESGTSSCQAKRSSSGEFRKVTRMCFAMFLVYVTCYFPFCFLHVVDGKKRAPVLVHMVSGNFTWLNSCINPILYAIMNRQFKDAYWGVLRKGANLLARPWRQ